jgi:hypothetical protein
VQQVVAISARDVIVAVACPHGVTSVGQGDDVVARRGGHFEVGQEEEHVERARVLQAPVGIHVQGPIDDVNITQIPGRGRQVDREVFDVTRKTEHGLGQCKGLRRARGRADGIAEFAVVPVRSVIR